MHRLALVALAFALLVVAARASVLHVPKDFPTVAEALAAAQTGDDVVLASGTYDELISLTSMIGVRLRGQGKVVLVGNGTATPPLRMTGCSGVTIERLSVDAAAGDAILLDSCVNCTLRRLTVHGAGTAGIVVDESGGVLVESCRVDGAGADGITIVTGNLNTFSRCTVTDVVGAGLSISDAEGCTIERCHVSVTGADGIVLGKLMIANGCLLDRNIVADAGSFGIRTSGSDNVVRSNLVLDSGFADVRVDADDQLGLVQGNRAIGGQTGFDVSGTGPLVRDNRSIKSTGRGFFIAGLAWALDGNRAQQAGGAGFDLTINQAGGSVAGCKATHCGEDGFLVETDGTTYEGNVATGSGFRGFKVTGTANVFVGNASHGSADVELEDMVGGNTYFDNDFGDA